MDILRFINSDDIKKYLSETGYEFSPTEAAWIIYKSLDATVKEKHDAWNELIKTMPDCALDSDRNVSGHKSLHEFLKYYIDLEDKYIDDFLSGKKENNDQSVKYVYSFEYVYRYGKGTDRQTVYSSVELFRTDVFEPCRKMYPEVYGDITELICIRLSVDSDDVCCPVLYLSPDFEIKGICPCGMSSYDSEPELIFADMSFCTPVPFRKGDIVWNPHYQNPALRQPFVLNSIFGREKESAFFYGKNTGDEPDMCLSGYFAGDDGRVYAGHGLYDYMDLEYYTDQPEGSLRTLVPYSSYIKGEIDTELFAQAYHRILLELNAVRSTPRDLNGKQLVKSGIKQPEHKKIWLDDLRDAPEGYVRCFSVNGAIEIIKEIESAGDIIDIIDCDHDMGYMAKYGGDGIKLIEWLADRQTYYPVRLHTMNPVGRENMQRIIDRYWEEK